MSKQETAGFSRRKFVSTICPMIVGGIALPREVLHAQSQQPGFWTAYTAEELETIESSFMAQDAKLHMYEGGSLGVSTRLALAPFDLGVTQRFEIVIFYRIRFFGLQRFDHRLIFDAIR